MRRQYNKNNTERGSNSEITTLASKNFNMTKEMLRIDEDLVQRQLKDIEQLELVFSKIPTKSLYKLQMSVAQEVQSRERTDATNLETTKEAKEVLETILTEV
jgi:hypothetical protein